MNELTITPNLEMKSARIRGRCAAGEHVRVRLVGMATLSSETTRLCVVLRERLFAVFPLADGDNATEWTVDGNDLTCVLNLNTEPLVKFARVGALTLEFILDDPSNNILYFSEMHEIMPWHSLRANGDDAKPRDTPPFDGVVVSTKTLADLREAVRRLAQKGGAKIIGAVAVALLAVSGVFAATVQTVPLNELDLDSNPSVVTNVTLEGLATTEEVASVDARVDGKADATNVYTKAEANAKIVELAPVQPDALASKADVLHGEAPALVSDNYITNNVFANGAALWELWLPGFDKIRNWSSWRTVADELNSIAQAASNYTDSATSGLLRTETDPTISSWAKAVSKPTYTASEVGAIPTTGGVFNASLHLNQKLSVGTWTSSVKPYDISGGSGIAFVFGDNVQTKQSNTMTLGVGALNTNAWSFIWNGDADRMYTPGFPAMSNPYATRHNGGFHVNPSVRSGMVNPLQNFWIGDTNLNDWISVLAPTPTWDTLSGKPTFATVATSGAYSDLSGKPTIPTTAADVGALSINGGTLNGGVTVWGDSTFYGNVFSFSDTFKIKFMDAVMTPYFEILGNSVMLPLEGGTLALISDIPTTMAWGAITGKPTTISGYGITDALKSDFTSLTNNAAFTSAVAAVSPPTDLTHVEAEIETNRTAIATLSARAYIEVVSADEVYYVFTTNQE